MENRLDELFKNGLHQYAVSPSENAWARIENRLTKKNSFAIVWRIAAAFFLTGSLLSAIFWLQESANTKSNAVAVVTPSSTPTPMATTEAKPIAEITKSSITSTEKVQPIKPLDVVQKTDQSIANNNLQEEAQEEIARPKEVVGAIAPSAIAQTEKPIVLEFTLEPVETAVAAQAPEKNSGLKKFLNKAKELKNGEGGINLADFANRLFASNSKKDQDTNALN